MSDTKHSPYCRKEREIAEIHTDLRTVKKVVMGNGKGLNVTVPVLAQTVEKLDETVDGLKKGLSSFLKFQENEEGRLIGKEQVKRWSRWAIALLVTINLGMLGVIITLISKML